MDPDSLFFTFFYRTFMKQLKVQQQSIIPDARCSYLWDLKTGQAVHGFGHLCFLDARQNDLERCNVHYWDCLVNSKHQRSREVRQHLCMITLFYQPNPHAYMIVYGCLFVYSSSFHQHDEAETWLQTALQSPWLSSRRRVAWPSPVCLNTSPMTHSGSCCRFFA